MLPKRVIPLQSLHLTVNTRIIGWCSLLNPYYVRLSQISCQTNQYSLQLIPFVFTKVLKHHQIMYKPKICKIYSSYLNSYLVCTYINKNINLYKTKLVSIDCNELNLFTFRYCFKVNSFTMPVQLYKQ